MLPCVSSSTDCGIERGGLKRRKGVRGGGGFVIIIQLSVLLDWIVISVDQLPEKVVGYTRLELLAKTPKSLCIENKIDEK